MIPAAALHRRELATPTLEDGGRLLVVRFDRPHAALSWAPWNGGRARVGAVAWRHVLDGELGRNDDPRALLGESLAAAGLEGAVGLLTARDLASFDEVALTDGDFSVSCVATVGLSNALAAGDPPGPLRSAVGTINLLAQFSTPLAEEALVEACALCAEARTAAMLARAIPSRRTGRPATGTGTDCIVVAAPDEPRGEPYVGKHTALGALIGASVHEACARGIARWIHQR